MWDWIRSYSVPLYETFWSILGAKEYKFIYGRSLYEEFKSLNAADDEELLNDFRECADGVMKKASIHFGQPYFNSATMAGMYRMALKEIAAQRGLGFPIPQERFSERKPWWIRTQEITK
jgi:hypothetical protein